MFLPPVNSRSLQPALAELIDHWKYKADRALHGRAREYSPEKAKVWAQAAKDLQNTIDACQGRTFG